MVARAEMESAAPLRQSLQAAERTAAGSSYRRQAGWGGPGLP